MFKNLLLARKQALSGKALASMLLPVTMILPIFIFDVISINIISNASTDKMGILLSTIGFFIVLVLMALTLTLVNTVWPRLVAMISLDYNKVVTPLDMIRSRTVLRVLKLTVLYTLMIRGGNFLLGAILPNLGHNLTVLSLENVLLELVLVKFSFVIQLTLEYKGLDFISALGRSWDIISGSNLWNIILLRLSLIPLYIAKSYVILHYRSSYSNLFLGLAVIFLISYYTAYLDTVYYYNLSKSGTNEFGPYR